MVNISAVWRWCACCESFRRGRKERRTDGYMAGIIDLWSKRLARGAEPLLVPTIAAAIRAGRPWLSYQRPGCTIIGEADARKFDRHPHASN